MPRKPDLPKAIGEALIDPYRRLRMNPSATREQWNEWYQGVVDKFGKWTADVAWAIVEAHISQQQVNNYFIGDNQVPQNNNPGGTNVTQTAGGNMMGVNATGEQKFRDITVYSQDLNQSGATINAEVRTALVEARDSIEKSEIDPAMKPMVVEQFDKLTEELKKGEKKNAGVVTGLWNMVYGAVKAVPGAVAAVASLEKLKGLIGF